MLKFSKIFLLIALISTLPLFSASNEGFKVLSRYGHFRPELGRIDDGIETCAWDTKTQRVVYTFRNLVGVLNINDPSHPVHEKDFISSDNRSLTCVAAYNGIAAACGNSLVDFWDIKTGMLIKSVTVGTGADNIQFSPNGKYVVVANEGDADGSDGNGSISVIDISNGIQNAVETQLDFNAFTYDIDTEQGFDTDDYQNNNWIYQAGPFAINNRIHSPIYDEYYFLTSWAGQSDDHDGYNGWYDPEGTFLTRGWADYFYVNGNGAYVFKNMQNAPQNPNNLGFYIDFAPRQTYGFTVDFTFNYAHVSLKNMDTLGYFIEYNNGNTWSPASFVSILDTSKNIKNNNYPYVNDVLDQHVVIDGAQHSMFRIRFYARFFGADSTKAAYIDEVKVMARGIKKPLDSNMYIPANYYEDPDVPNYVAHGSYGVEPEYVAITPDSKWAFVTLQENNAIAKVDLTTRKIVKIFPCGFVDNMNPNNSVNFAKYYQGQFYNYPFHSMKMPDGIIAFESNGHTYLMTANEGEDGGMIRRGSYSEVLNMPGIKGIDTTVFHDLTIFTDQNKVGDFKRFLLEPYMVDQNGDSLVDRLVPLGGRNYTIYDTDGNIVNEGESLDHFFPGTDDQRAMGQEPEGVTTGWVDGHHYAFMVLERAGSMMIYNIDNPAQATFSQKISVGSRPEYVVFIPGSESPTGEPLVVNTNETDQLGITVTGYSYAPNLTTQLNSNEAITGMDRVIGTNNRYYLSTGRGSVVFKDGKKTEFKDPNYKPKILLVERTDSGMNVIDSITIKMNGVPMSGLPSMTPGMPNYTTEIPVDINGNQINYNGESIYPGAIADGLGNDLWVADKYGDRIFRINKTTGEVIKVWTPYGPNPNLDTLLKYNRKLLGFSCLVRDCNGNVWATTEVPVDLYYTNATDLTLQKSTSKMWRLVMIDPAADTTAYYGLNGDDKYRFTDMKFVSKDTLIVMGNTFDNPYVDKEAFYIFAKSPNLVEIPANVNSFLEKNYKTYATSNFVWNGKTSAPSAGYLNDYFFPYGDFESLDVIEGSRIFAANFNNYQVSNYGVGDAYQLASVPTMFMDINIPGLFLLPSDVRLKSPLNNSNFNLTNNYSMNLVWNRAEGAGSYHVQVSTNANFTNLIIDSVHVVDSTLFITGNKLTVNQKYWWRVLPDGMCTWKGAWAFTVFQPMTLSLSNKSTCTNIPVQIGNPNLITGGSGDFSIYWHPANMLNDAHIVNPTAQVNFGSQFKVTVTDNLTGEMVQKTMNLTINEGPSLSLNPLFLITSKNTVLDLNSYLTISGGSSPYITNWYDDNNNMIADPTNVIPSVGINKYYVEVSDAGGCISKRLRFIVVATPKKDGTEEIAIGKYGTGMLYAYPNPTESTLNVVAEFADQTNIKVRITDLLGNEVYRGNEINDNLLEESLNVGGFAPGSYSLIIETDNDVIVKQFIKK